MYYDTIAIKREQMLNKCYGDPREPPPRRNLYCGGNTTRPSPSRGVLTFTSSTSRARARASAPAVAVTLARSAGTLEVSQSPAPRAVQTLPSADSA